MSNTLRKIRIAFSASCGILCLLLIVMWVRSCNTSDTLFGRFDHYRVFRLDSAEGGILLIIEESEVGEWEIHSLVHSPGIKEFDRSRWRFSKILPWGYAIVAPYWFFVAAFAILGIAFWRPPRRFSLRTLLIATTLVAAILGALVYSLR